MRRVVQVSFENIVLHGYFFGVQRRETLDAATFRYLPPPAQAQAQPAQAHAQAQERPPLPPERPLLLGGGGGGLVTLVTRPVNSFTLPMTFCENVCTPVTIEAAKSAPGRPVELLPGDEGTDTGVDEEPPPLQTGS